MDTVGEATEDIQRISHSCGAPGILVLSAQRKVLHVNHRGWELIHDFDSAKLVKTSWGMLPCVVSEVLEDLQRIAREQFSRKDVTHIEVRRMGAAAHPILVRGLVLPGSGSSGFQSRILILLELVGREQRREQFRFTDREEMDFQNLAKGRSNKEIASDLTIAGQTGEGLDQTGHG